MIYHDWKCPEHGEFEATHGICPADDCESDGVVKVYRRAPGLISGATRRFDSGIRQSAETMGLSNFRSARPGEASYVGNADKLLWGENARSGLPGKSFLANASNETPGGVLRQVGGTFNFNPKSSGVS